MEIMYTCTVSHRTGYVSNQTGHGSANVRAMVIVWDPAPEPDLLVRCTDPDQDPAPDPSLFT
jgi:hypothetical protein